MFLDFYSRIVKDEKFFITFVCKRPYNSDYENYGYDEVYYSINDGELVKLIDFAGETSRFDTPVTFGATYDSSNIPIRYLVGKMKNFYILLEE